MINNVMLETNKTKRVLICRIVQFPRKKPLLPTCPWLFEQPLEQGRLLQGINEQDAFASIIQKSV